MKRSDHLCILISDHLNRIAAMRLRALDLADPEGLHDLRVALRGLRACLPLLDNKGNLPQLRRDWQSLARATGPARDLEVLLALLDRQPAPPAGLREKLEKEQRSARQRLTRQLCNIQLPHLLQSSRSELNAALERTRPRELRRRITHRSSKLLVKIKQRIANLSPSDPPQNWHQLRLDIKRLRYLIELCGEWLPERYQHIHSELKRCQGLLGDLHDLDILAGLVKTPMIAEREMLQQAAWQTINSLASTLNHRRAFVQKRAIGQ
jgi:CHAD domain-containing protein